MKLLLLLSVLVGFFVVVGICFAERLPFCASNGALIQRHNPADATQGKKTYEREEVKLIRISPTLQDL